MTKALEIIGLRKSFGARQALDGVALELAAGERLALLGPNGAGKTTLIRCLCGLTKPDSGEIRLFGEVLPPSGGRDALGVVPQEIALYQDLSARENLNAFGRFAGLGRRQLRDRVEWALQWTGLAADADTQVRGFSGGMKRRVNIACGVLHAPRVILLDEPTVGVDPQSRQRIFEMLAELHRAGTAILLTTHHLEEAETQCDRIVIIDHGQVAAAGSLEELIDQTVGNLRRVRLRVAETIEVPVPPWTLGDDGYGLETSVHHVATQLPELLALVHQAGYTVDDVEVRSPSLHHVFLHLTGHETRD